MYILTWSRVLGDEVVTIYVGPERKKSIVHKKLLCNRSSFFAKAFNGSFKEAQEGVMYLPEDNADAFSLLVDFLYRGIVPKIVGKFDPHKSSISPLRFFYFLAEKLCMSDLMDRIIDEISKYCAQEGMKLGDQAIRVIYANTHDKSKLRAYCVANLACCISERHYNEAWCERYSSLFASYPEFFLDMFRYQVKHAADIRRSERTISGPALAVSFEPCEFHTHETGACYLKPSN